MARAASISPILILNVIVFVLASRVKKNKKQKKNLDDAAATPA